jgi:hypothetical protein
MERPDYDFHLLGSVDERQTRIAVSIKGLVECDLLKPDIQRLIDEDRVQEIVAYQEEYFKKHQSLFFIGDVTMVDFNERYYIIDGLHRFEALKMLVHLHPEYLVGVNIIHCVSRDEMIDAFVTINKTLPVPEHVIRNANNRPKRAIIEEFRSLLRKHFKPYFSDSNTPHRPNIYENNVIDYVNKSDIERFFGTGVMIFKYMLFVNNKYLAVLDTKNSKRCQDKAEKYGTPFPLYLTNDPEYSWLRNEVWINEFIQKLSKTTKLHCNLNFTNATQGAGGDAASKWQNKLKFWKKEAKKQRTESCKEDPIEDFMSVDDEDIETYDIPDVRIEETPVSISTWQLPAKIGRRAIPKQLRGVVWRNYFASIDHECPLCTNIISLDDFECGHIVSVKNGGSNHPTNMLPICGKCNKSMSSMNLHDYVQQYGLRVKYSSKNGGHNLK